LNIDPGPDLPGWSRLPGGHGANLALFCLVWLSAHASLSPTTKRPPGFVRLFRQLRPDREYPDHPGSYVWGPKPLLDLRGQTNDWGPYGVSMPMPAHVLLGLIANAFVVRAGDRKRRTNEERVRDLHAAFLRPSMDVAPSENAKASVLVVEERR
jgi:hypothetical protein